MANICPRCGGTEVGCPICNAPPMHDHTEPVGGDMIALHYPLPEGIRISQLFGANPTWYPVSKGHNGVDWACALGTSIYAMKKGTVLVARNDGKAGYGRHVRISHADGGVSIYGHLSEIWCNVGDNVEAGEQIGLSGGATSDPGSGWSTGPHLHGEMRYPDIPNPVPGGYTYGAINILPLLVEGQDWEVQGVDLSAWNGVMDLSITHKKVQYLHIRLGYGDGWKDSRCDNYRDQAIAEDMPYFGYWFANIGQSVDKHANGFASVAAEKPGIIGLDEDYERTYLTDKTATLNWIKNFDGKLKTLTTLKTRPYSNYNFWNTYVAPNAYFTERQWAAHWTQAPTPMMPPGWKWEQGCEWQWSADGNGLARAYGMISDGDNDMDLDRYYGTVAEFNEMYGTHILPIGEIVPPEPPRLPEFFYPNGSSGYINIRYNPDPYSDAYVIGKATNGKKWHPIEIVKGTDGKEWWKINEYAYCAKWLTKW